MTDDKIRVAVRLRPINKRELELKSQNIVKIDGSQVTLNHPSQGSKLETGKRGAKVFTYDHCFDSSDPDIPSYASQAKVYEALRSGKSYTMMGTESQRGLIPRLSDDIFKRIQDSKEESFCVEMSYMEIYNEKVYDLLNPNGCTSPLRVREHNILGPYVVDLSSHAVTSFEDVEHLMSEGSKARTVAATNMNNESSRSHAIFTLVITASGAKQDGGLIIGERVSRVSLVDLAGSERASKSGTVKDRLREGSNINRSLTTLGLVISKLAEQPTAKTKDIFIPYRDSLLTWLLRDSLGGNSRTLMIATISPSADNYDETLSTLRYADQAKRIVNHAVVNEDPNAQIIRKLEAEIEFLREQLTHATQKSDLQERLTESKRLVEEASRTWEEKLQKTEQIQAERTQAFEKLGFSIQNSGLKADHGAYYLVNLSPDPSLNEMLVYYLKNGTTVGRADAFPPPDIQLSGLGIQSHHCTLSIEDSQLWLIPNEGALCHVNGSLVNQRTSIRHDSRILFGLHHFFKVNCPKVLGENGEATGVEGKDDTLPVLDYSYAMQEIEMAEHNFDPVKVILTELEKQHTMDKNAALAQQKEDYERRIQDMLTGLSSTNSLAFYGEGTGNIYRCLSRSTIYGSSSSLSKDENFVRSLAKLKEEIIRAKALTREANHLAQELHAKASFSLTLQIPISNLTPHKRKGSLMSEPAIMVQRLGKSSQVWTMEKFENKLVDMRDLHQAQGCLGEVGRDIFDWEDSHTLIGVGNFFLDVLFHDGILLDHEVPIISQQGDVAGKLLMEVGRIEGSMPSDRENESSSDDGATSDDGASKCKQITIQVCIKKASGLPASLSHYVFCQYSVPKAIPGDPIVVPPVESSVVSQGLQNSFSIQNPRRSLMPAVAPRSVHDHSLASMTTFHFDHVQDFQIQITDEFLDFCMDGALSIEVWGHQSAGFSKDSSILDSENSQQVLQAHSLRDRWKDVKRQLQLSVEIQELDEQGNYSPVEIEEQKGVVTGGMALLRQGQQRRLLVQVKPVENSGTLPLVCEEILGVDIGSVTLRCYMQASFLSLCLLVLILMYMLMNQWVALTEERNAVMIPLPGSGIPGAPIPPDYTPQLGMERHIPVLFLDLNDDMCLNAMEGEEGEEKGIPTAAINSTIPKEYHNSMIPLQIQKQLKESVGVIALWDSAIHDTPFLRKFTNSNDRVYLILRAYVRLSLPTAMNIILRKRLCVQIVKRSHSGGFSSLWKKFGRQERISQLCITYEIVSRIPRASEDFEDRESLAQLAASQEEGDSVTIDGETYIEKYSKGVSAVEGILALDRLRQNVALKEKLQGQGKSITNLDGTPRMRKTFSVPDFPPSSIATLVTVSVIGLYFALRSKKKQ
ncbi:unnamed protein product [Darwinula stevensoni]|uniref:Kinesin motor domain-containing protein n=1 Tax=Darwinula stevensoni TaxID=69355 RepID=A0A7R9A2C8_9CRUS|nr:unnamed protein product [Darwinula stevensoni]CAG0889433.1 unnamed protein product [Darwinula stevensoni]